MRCLSAAFALLTAVSCSNVEVGYTDIERAHDTTRLPPRDEESPRTKVVVDRYLVETAETDAALPLALAGFRDATVNLEGDEALVRHGLSIYACRPGSWDDIEKLLTGARARRESGMCQSEESMTFQFLAADRDVTVMEAMNGIASSRELKVVKSMLEVETLITRGGGIQVTLTPELFVAEPEMAAWTLPDVKTKLVVDAGRAVVIHAESVNPNTFGPSWLHTGKEGARKRVILVLAFHLRA